jgi:hypothetical protein
MSLPNEVNLHHLGSTGYSINQSLRFRASASAYLNRTPGSASNRTTWTLSFWTKRGILGGDRIVFNAGTTGSSDIDIFFPSDQFMISDRSGWQAKTTQLFRDTSAWYHFVVALDTTQATDTNRIKMYVNGTQITSFASPSYPAQNATSSINNNVAHRIGTRSLIDNLYDGYLTEMNFIDGQQLTPSSFGETDSETGAWKPKRFSGTYGTNGFYLPFSNTSSTSTLGNDFSGNSNTWTVNNISLTAGSTYDWMRDSPTLGTLASNYAVLNNNIPGAAVINGGLTRNSSSGRTSCSTIPLTNGKYYFETTIQDANGNGGVGVKQSTAYPLGDYETAKCATYFSNGEYKIEGATQTSGFSSFTNGDVIGIAVDTTQSPAKIWFAKNNTWQGTGNPTTAGYSLTSGLDYLFMVLHGSGSSSTTASVNFGQQPWAYTPPTGYSALNTYNLPTPTIGATSATQANKYFDIGLYTGDGSATARAISGPNTPDFVWIKRRSVAAGSHALYDALRGFGKRIYSNLANSEADYGSAQLAPTTTGFNLTTSDPDHNTNGSNYVAWQWNAGNSTVTNNNGSISSQVRANPSVGFSVVTYTLNNSTFTVGHGLGVTPKMMLVKNRDTGNNWDVYHSSVGAGYRLQLNAADGATSTSQVWNNTTPTSTVFSGDSAWWSNPSTSKMVAYCFAPIAGYSAFGDYLGNGSSDGTFVYLGFRPKFFLIKPLAGGQRWQMWDSSRGTYNANGLVLWPNDSAGEQTGYGDIDFLSNGVKLRNTSGYVNDSGTTYIYMAFAENPFKYALAK